MDNKLHLTTKLCVEIMNSKLGHVVQIRVCVNVMFNLSIASILFTRDLRAFESLTYKATHCMARISFKEFFCSQSFCKIFFLKSPIPRLKSQMIGP